MHTCIRTYLYKPVQLYKWIYSFTFRDIYYELVTETTIWNTAVKKSLLSPHYPAMNPSLEITVLGKLQFCQDYWEREAVNGL